MEVGQPTTPQPRHVWVHFGSGDMPGIAYDYRPKRRRGGISAWEVLVVYASRSPATGDTTLTHGWVAGDMIRPARG